MSVPIALFCKSYRDDVLRARRMIESVERYNSDSLLLYVSVPQRDVDLFSEHCKGLKFSLLTDEEIVAANERIDATDFASLPGGVSQQIVKAEFWRMEMADAYVCLDSDCVFLRPFGEADFVSPNGVPYTVMHEAKDLLHFAGISGMERVFRDRERECGEIKDLFARVGRCWDFGPVPVVWSSHVWRDLSERYLEPQNMTLVDAIRAHPGELRWYGEALLAYKSIPIIPVEPLFRCYHYEEQYYFWKRMGETEKIVARTYLGVCMQSNWDKGLDLTKRFRFSKLRRRVRRLIRGY